MAKKGGKSSGAVSSGIHSNVNRKTLNAARREYRQSGQRVLNQMAALRKGKDVVMTIANPNKNETNKRFIKVRVSGKEYIANLKKNAYRIKGDAVEA